MDNVDLAVLERGCLLESAGMQGMGDADAFQAPEIGFPSYHGYISILDRGAAEEIRFRKCKGNENLTLPFQANP